MRPTRFPRIRAQSDEGKGELGWRSVPHCRSGCEVVSGRGGASQQRSRPPQRGAFAQHEACIRQDKTRSPGAASRSHRENGCSPWVQLNASGQRPPCSLRHTALNKATG
jgi:hypothetical protein